MKKISIIFCLISFLGQAQSNSKQTLTSKETVQSFFTNFGNSNLEGIYSLFSDNTKIISINKKGIEGVNLYGTFNGQEGLKTFLTTLSNTFDTQSFQVDHIIGEGDVAFASGSFVHKVKATDKLFESDWALMCIVKQGKIVEYHFFEDSASFVLANK